MRIVPSPKRAGFFQGIVPPGFAPTGHRCEAIHTRRDATHIMARPVGERSLMRLVPFLAIAAAAVCTLWAPGVLAQQTRPPAARELLPAELVAELRRGNDIVYFRHTATDHTQSDAKMKSYEDCAHQRNLIDQGRRDAQLIGAWIRALSIPIGKILASP